MTNFNRPDVYRNIHKALRKVMFDFSYAAGRIDIWRDEQLQVLNRQFDAFVGILELHGAKEDNYSLPLLESKRAGSTKHNEEEHEQIQAEIEGLKQQMSALIDSREAHRTDCYWNFYYAVNNFISTYLMHMQMEEIVMTNLFYELCSDEELQAMTAAILNSLTPADSMMILPNMIPAIEPSERLHMMSRIRMTALPSAFDALMKLCKEVLPPVDFLELKEELDSATLTR
ncbi:MAG TPA: hemerythrin domain-containing protein [Bacteroidia bacterium]|nr:hemerythrin domain-containing protein [Bacteroidia bacterium]